MAGLFQVFSVVRISCSCGEAHFEVPCGTETEQKPPRCRKPCHIAPLCKHGPNCKPHKCHYGAYLPCRLICGERYPCGHECNLRCYGPKPPPGREFTLKPRKKKSNYSSEVTPGSLCPPCPELVLRSCFGNHMGAERMMVCSNNKEFSCDNLCGNPLPCGNHYCTYVCHPLKSCSSKPDGYSISESCEECNLTCEKPNPRETLLQCFIKRNRSTVWMWMVPFLMLHCFLQSRPSHIIPFLRKSRLWKHICQSYWIRLFSSSLSIYQVDQAWHIHQLSRIA